MPFSEDSINKYLPLIQTGLSVAGNYLGGRAQNQAITRASGINQQATNDAMRMILGLYDEGQGQLAPYRNVGPQALNNLQSLTNRGSVPAPASVQPAPTGNALARFGPQSGANPLATGSGSVTNAMGPAGLPSQQAGGTGARNSLIGTGVGLGAAGALGAAGLVGGTAAGTAAGAAWGAIGGPIGIGLGAAGGLIASQFGKNNPYKAAASKGIDEVSRQVWGTNTPGIPPEQLTSGIVADVMQRRIPVAEGKARVNKAFEQWAAGMRQNGTPESVIRSSFETQKQAFAPLKDVFARLESQPA